MLASRPAAYSEANLAALNARFRHESPQQLIEWTVEELGAQAVLTCSFGGASGMVLLDMVARLNRETPIIFLDTGLLFEQTYQLAEQVAQRYAIPITIQRPALTLGEQEVQFGPRLFAHDPDRCCGLRKVAPLAEALRPYAAWISGIRRDQASTRAATEPLQWSEKHQLLKISPLAFWTDREVWRYIHAHQVPYNTLLDQGYPSLGCVPCTRPASGENSRAGRWVGTGKVECGIHI